MELISNINFIEMTATILAIAYLLLAIKQNILCWYAAFCSSILYIFIFLKADLYMESFLQVFYALIAIYGWRKWKQSNANLSNSSIISMKITEHFVFIFFILVLTLLSGFLMSYTQANFPYLDSFTTIAAIFTTFLVAKRILENWLYWIIIDSCSIYIYLEKSLYITSFLFMFYLVLALFGYFSWRKFFYDSIKKYDPKR